MLDNASEGSLRRSADAVLSKTAMYGQVKRQLSPSPVPVDAEMEALLAEVEPLAVSRTTIRKIERSYESLVDFVASREA